jgi:hypothetical protein
VLASYRGYDTLGETTVVFTAGAGVIALLRRRQRKSSEKTAGKPTTAQVEKKATVTAMAPATKAATGEPDREA